MDDQHYIDERSIPPWTILVAVIIGGLFGYLMPEAAVKVEIAGTIFLNLLFMLVIPLIIASMVTGVARLGDIRHVGVIGVKTLIYYMATTFLAVLTGILLVIMIVPGRGVIHQTGEFPNAVYHIDPMPLSGGSALVLADSTFQFPKSLNSDQHRIMLMDQGIAGVIDETGVLDAHELRIVTWLDEAGSRREPQPAGTGISVVTRSYARSERGILDNYLPRNIFTAMTEDNIFPLILVSLVFGAILSTLGDAGKPLLAVFSALNLVVIKAVMLLMYVAPIGIFGLVAGSIGEAELNMEGGFAHELVRLSRYTITVLAGLGIHGFLTLVLILWLFGHRNPLTYLRNMIPQWLTAFSTASSLATLPVSIALVTGKNKISRRIAGFVLPIGATINMDGTALYEGVAAVFIAQSYGIELGLPSLIIMMVTAMIASIGAAAIPQAGLITLVLVLKSVGLPLEGIGMILSIDWFIDRCRTSVNVWGDAVGAAVIDYMEPDTGIPRQETVVAGQ